MITQANLPRLPTPEALLLDMDDTLVDVTDSYRAATILTAAHFGVSVGLDDVSGAKAAGDANDEWILTWRLIHESNTNVTLEQVTEVYELLYHGDDRNAGLKESEKLLLNNNKIASLAGRFPLGIVTGRPRRDAVYILDRLDIAQFFQALVTFDDGPLKPDPHPVRLALTKLGVQSAWLVGDTPDDMRAACRAGVIPIGVVAPSDDKSRATTALLAAGAVIVLDQIEDIFSLLAGS